MEKWLREAVDSCLEQSYPRIEIIVIDDGSTDNCLAIIKSYNDKIIWETGPNRGGNYARNRGFALSSGEYIQYLDADDYLLPEKIERQVRFLEETGADVVYSDWRYKRHLPNGTSLLEDINVSGPKEDFLESLLANERWVPPVALLFNREIISSSSGWDERLKAAQDRDFLISLAVKGAKIEYQPGGYSIYRKYGSAVTITSNKSLWLESHFLVMGNAEAKLVQMNKLSCNYRKALARGYYVKSRLCNNHLDFSRNLWLLRKILLLDPDFKVERSTTYNLVQKIFGFLIAQTCLKFTKRLLVKSETIQSRLIVIAQSLTWLKLPKSFL